MSKITEEILEDVESLRHRQEDDKQRELDLSINDWIFRLQGISGKAHNAARAGATSTELELWIEAAAICVARAEILAQLVTGELVFVRDGE